MSLTAVLQQIVGLSLRFPRLIAGAGLFSAILAIIYATQNLGINTNTADMIANHLDWRQQYIAYTQAFPDNVDVVVAVVDGPNLETAEHAGQALSERLRQLPEQVQWVQFPAADPFFVRHALLYLTVEDLEPLGLRLAAAQPLLAQLSQSPDITVFLGTLRQALSQGDGAGAVWATSADTQALAASLSAVAAGVNSGPESGDAVHWSWRSALHGGQVRTGPARAVVTIKPHLDFGEPFPLDPLLRALRPIVTTLEREMPGVSVRFTGGIAMSNEELKSVSHGMGFAGAGALALVCVILVVGLRSVAAVGACLLCLVIGLCWTAAFAAWAIGSLNLISVAFAVLYVGLGVDYAIHYAMRAREALDAGSAVQPALATAGTEVGSALALCAVSTGIGFYAFVPTDFAGVAELGLISGTGMFISLAATLLLMPALLLLFGSAPQAASQREVMGAASYSRPRRSIARWAVAHRRLVLALTLAVGLGAIATSTLR